MKNTDPCPDCRKGARCPFRNSSFRCTPDRAVVELHRTDTSRVRKVLVHGMIYGAGPEAFTNLINRS